MSIFELKNNPQNLLFEAFFGIILALGMQLYRQELYFKNCKPAMIQSRKRGSKIHGDGITKARGLMRQFADVFTPKAPSAYGVLTA